MAEEKKKITATTTDDLSPEDDDDDEMPELEAGTPRKETTTKAKVELIKAAAAAHAASDAPILDPSVGEDMTQLRALLEHHAELEVKFEADRSAALQGADEVEERYLSVKPHEVGVV